MIRLSSSISYLLLAVAVVLGVPATASSQPIATEQAEQHYARGVAYAQENDYQRALDEFQSSYQLRQVPRILINIGTANFRLGNARQGLSVFEAYLKVEPNAPSEIRKKVQDLIGQCKAAIGAQELWGGPMDPAAPDHSSKQAHLGRRTTTAGGQGEAVPQPVLIGPAAGSQLPLGPELLPRRAGVALRTLSWSMFAAASLTTILVISLNHTSVGRMQDPTGQAEVANILTPASYTAGFLSAVSFAVAIPLTVLVNRAIRANQRSAQRLQLVTSAQSLPIPGRTSSL